MSAKAAGMNADRKIIELVDIIIDQKSTIELGELVRESMEREIDQYKQQVSELHNEVNKLRVENIDYAMRIANIKKEVHD